MAEPMSSERWKEIKRLIEGPAYSRNAAVLELLAEVERLRGENANLQHLYDTMFTVTEQVGGTLIEKDAEVERLRGEICSAEPMSEERWAEAQEVQARVQTTGERGRGIEKAASVIRVGEVLAELLAEVERLRGEVKGLVFENETIKGMLDPPWPGNDR